MRSVALIITAVAMSGCISVSWPPKRGGGMAELAPPQRHHIVLHQAKDLEIDLITTLHGQELRLEMAIKDGAVDYVPAEVSLARKLTARIRREIAGTLYSDAQADMIELGDRLAVIEGALASIKHERERLST